MGSDLVLLHGWAMSPRVWEPVIPALAEAHRLHNLALPGYGNGRHRPPGRYRGMDARAVLNQWTDDCLAAAPRGAVWMGWSLGAMIAMNAALRATGAVQALVLVAATPKFIGDGDWQAGVERRVMRGFLDGLRGGDRQALKRFLLLQAGGRDDPRGLARSLSEYVAGGDVDRTVLSAGLDVLDGVDLRAELPSIDVPVAVVHGVGDRITPPAAGAYVAQHLPHAEWIELDTGHAPFVSQPADFAEAVLSWM